MISVNNNKNGGDIGKLFFIFILFIALAWVMCSVSSCCSKKPLVAKPEPEIHTVHDTIKTVERHDSIVNHYIIKRDSSSFRKEDSLIYIERWHWERDYSYEKILEAKIDSFSHVKRDSIPYPVPQEVRVPADIKKWQRGLMWWGGTSILLILMWLVMKIKTGFISHKQG